MLTSHLQICPADLVKAMSHHQESENSDGDFKESLGRIAAPRALDLGYLFV